MEEDFDNEYFEDEFNDNEFQNNQHNDLSDMSSIIKERNNLLDICICYSFQFFISIAFGYEEFKEGTPRVGWLLNMLATTVETPSGPPEAAVELFFIEQSGSLFKGIFLYRYFQATTTDFYRPYFYIYAKPGKERTVMNYLERNYHEKLADLEIIRKLDLDKPNHLVAEYSLCSPFSPLV